MVTKGEKPDFSGIDKVEAVPIEQAQLYLSRLANDLSEDGDVSNLYFVHDGETGTSHNFVTEAEGIFFRTETFANTRFDRVLDACIAVSNSLRVWWANSPIAHLEVVECDMVHMLKKTIADQMYSRNRAGEGIGVAYALKKSM
ncbi:MAG: hypothetical protein AAB116_05790 [Candidatus Poribacteria bacterium]